MCLRFVPTNVTLKADDGQEFHNQLFLPKDIKPGERRPALSTELPARTLREDIATGAAATVMFRNWIGFLSTRTRAASPMANL